MKWNWSKALFILSFLVWVVGSWNVWAKANQFQNNSFPHGVILAAQGTSDFESLKQAMIGATILKSVTPEILEKARKNGVLVFLELTEENARFSDQVDAVVIGSFESTEQPPPKADKVIVRDYEFTQEERATALRMKRIHKATIYRGHWVSQKDMESLSDNALLARFSRADTERSNDVLVLPDWPIEKLIPFVKKLPVVLARTGLHNRNPLDQATTGWTSVTTIGLLASLVFVGLIYEEKNALTYGAAIALLLVIAFPIFADYFPRDGRMVLSATIFGACLAWAAISKARAADWATLITFSSLITFTVAHAASLASMNVLEVSGVKALFLLPIGAAVTTALFLAFRDGWKPKFWEVILLATIAPICWYMIVRSGNDPIGGVSSTEWGLRAWFDQVFWVRPRFKEFAIGVPALVFLLAARRRPDFPVAIKIFLVFLASICLASMVNTFLHPYADLKTSIARTAIGIFLGSIIAVGALLVFHMIPWTRHWFQKANG